MRLKGTAFVLVLFVLVQLVAGNSGHQAHKVLLDTTDKRVVTAAQEGAFHENFHIDLELSSEFLASGDATSRHKVVVMRDLEDDVLSFAIDEFPVMDEAAIEEHWVRKVQAKRAVREDAFDRMEAQWEAEHPTAAAGMEAARQAKLEKSMKSRLAYIARSLSSDHEEL